MRNEMTLDAIARELERNCGDELAAARSIGVSLHFINQWRKDDKAVDERLTEAARVGAQGLVSAAIQRAVHGVQEDVYFKGKVCGQKTSYSDGLLQTLLKAKVPEFAKEAGDGGSVQVQVNVANLMPRATSYEQWLSMKQQTLERHDVALPAPSDEVIDAEYVEVPKQTAFAGIEL